VRGLINNVEISGSPGGFALPGNSQGVALHPGRANPPGEPETGLERQYVKGRISSVADFCRGGRISAGHHHDGPRTWIRGRMAPRRLRPAGLFSGGGNAARAAWGIAPRWISRKASGGVIPFPRAPSRLGNFPVDVMPKGSMVAVGHHHDGPRTWIRGRMAPRGSKPAGFFLVQGQGGDNA